MKPFEIPTDNLYKFMAIAGVATCLLSLYLAISITINLQQDLYEHFVEQKIQRLEFSEIEEDVTELSEISTELKGWIVEAEAKGVDEDGARVVQLPLSFLDEYQNLKNSLSQLQARQRRLHGEVVREDMEHSQLNLIGNRVLILSALLWFFAFIGLAVSVWGFYLWYTRVQRYQDQKIMLESK